MKYLFVLIGLITSQFINGQQVNVDFDHIVMEEKFEAINKTWPQIFNSENIALSQPGHYEMRRVNDETGNFVFPKMEKNLASFEVVLNLEFTKQTEKSASAGMLVKCNEEKGTGVLVELRNDKSYRVSKISEFGSVFYTNKQDEGWIRDKEKLNKRTNIIKVKADGMKYDIYFNDNFVYTFTEPAFKAGKIGLFIGPKSHAFYKSIVLKTFTPNLNGDPNSNNSNQNLEELKTKIKLQQNEIDRLKAMQENNSRNISEIKELSTANKNLSNTILEKETFIDSLNKKNESLLFFKKSIESAPEGETINALSKTIDELRNEKAYLKEQIALGQSKSVEQEANIKAWKEQSQQLQEHIKDLNDKIAFLVRQIDWINLKLQTDSMHIIDTIRNKGQGYLEMPLKDLKYNLMRTPSLKYYFIKPA